MKKLLFILPILCIMILIIILNQKNMFNLKTLFSKNNEYTKIGNEYIFGKIKENYIWTISMNLAWNELNENILKEKLTLNTTDKKALEIAGIFNNSKLSTNDIDEESYYIKAGYGQKTINQINKEVKEKFPKKTFSELKDKLQDTGIISYAYFFKNLEYNKPFLDRKITFNGKKVKGFRTYDHTQSENIKILNYENDDKFIIKILLKDNNDELLLAKGYNMENPTEVINKINKKDKSTLNSIDYRDIFASPNINLEYVKKYDDLIGKNLSNKGFEDYTIIQMNEKVNFQMDRKGAIAESEAVIEMYDTSSFDENYKPKNFTLNKPYWIIMKKFSSKNPYFILGVNNDEIMEAVE